MTITKDTVLAEAMDAEERGLLLDRIRRLRRQLAD